MPTDSRTRHRILNILKQRGPLEAKVLAGELNVTAMAIRQHLYQMQDQQLLTHKTEPRAVGRPAKLWVLTSKADQYFPDAHAALAVDLVSSLTATFGEKGLEQLVDARAKQQLALYSEQIPQQAPVREKLEKLAEIRTTEGYMAEVIEDEEGGLLFVENHCPICAAATACTGLCAAELDVFRSVMGKKTTVERTEHLLDGARRCAYEVKNLG